MIRSVSDISELPPFVVEEYRKKGWSDDEIFENFAAAVSFLNSNLRCCDLEEDLSLERIFSE